MKGPRYKLVEGVLGELKAHRGPVYLDCRHLDPEAMRHLVTTLAYDKDTFPEYFAQKGVDLSAGLMEIFASEGMQGGPNEVCGSGIKIDARCGASLAGLYAAGNSADQCRSLHMAFTSGIRAGRSTAAYAAGLKGGREPLPETRVRAIRERLFAPMAEARTVVWREFEDVLQRILSEGLGPVRSEWGMRKAWENLDRLEEWKDRVRAETFHDLCRVQEVFNMLTVARCMISAARFRKESRFGTCHHRLDYPHSDDNRFLGQIVVGRDVEGKIATDFLPLP
jgi:adenylylsulfate reductase subunit A